MSAELGHPNEHEDEEEEHSNTTTTAAVAAATATTTTTTTEPDDTTQKTTDQKPSEGDDAAQSRTDGGQTASEEHVTPPPHHHQGPQPTTASTSEEHSRSTHQQKSPAPPPRPPPHSKRGSHVRVSILEDVQEASPPPKRVSSSRLRMERELSHMKQAEDNERLRQKARWKKEVEKAVEGVERERQKQGVTLTPDVEACRSAVGAIMKEEESLALAKEQKRLRNETKTIQEQIQAKYALKDKKPHQDLVALAQNYYHGKVKDKDGIPEHVQRELTRQEMEDLRVVFDMFDVKGKGFISANDVRRAASMLGFKAKKKVFSEMIEELTGDPNGRVTFSHFLQFVVKGQGDGEDQLDAILQCFRLLDRDQKGYITAADLRHAADAQKVSLSNRAIREMIQEADISGDSKVTSDEFIHLMLQSSMFRTAH